MSKDSMIFISLDTHQSFLQVTVFQEHRGANPQHLGLIKSNKSALIKVTIITCVRKMVVILNSMIRDGVICDETTPKINY